MLHQRTNFEDRKPSRSVDILSVSAVIDLVTLTFDRGGHGACLGYGSSCSIYIPNLNFVGLPIWKIWRTIELTISWPDDLNHWPWNWCALLPVRWVTFLPILLFLGLFVLDLWANTCHTHHMPSRLRPLTLEVMALVGDMGLRTPSVY